MPVYGRDVHFKVIPEAKLAIFDHIFKCALHHKNTLNKVENFQGRYFELCAFENKIAQALVECKESEERT